MNAPLQVVTITVTALDFTTLSAALSSAYDNYMRLAEESSGEELKELYLHEASACKRVALNITRQRYTKNNN